MIREYIRALTERVNLSENQMKDLFNILMSGNATDAQIGAVLTALKMKGETEEEISAAAKIMREKSIPIPIKSKEKLIDTAGTGGDQLGTFNVSTIAGFVIAGAGAKVAKHGNRSISSKCGSADLIEALGIKLEQTPEQVAYAIQNIGFGFIFAPLFHPAMKNVIKQRREIGIKTIFNILGPLSNPAKAEYQIIGVFDKNLVPLIARVLIMIGIKKAYVVHGLEGLDEISITAPTLIAKVENNEIEIKEIKPEDFGLKRASLQDIKGADIEKNKEIALSILKGEDYSPKVDFIALNSAFALEAVGVVNSIKEGIELSKEVIYSKKAYEIVEKLRDFTNAS